MRWGKMRGYRGLFVGSLALAAVMVAGGCARRVPQPVETTEGEAGVAAANCYECHAQVSPGLAAQWKDSRHAEAGVGCLDCHGAEPGDPDAFEHDSHTIATIVTPKDCGVCHAQEEMEFSASHHSRAAQFVGSLDNVLGELAEGRLAAANGCWQCHGSTVRILTGPGGEPLRASSGAPRIDPLTWPNTGIGRVNLDGSNGTCSACHSRHLFSSKVARNPENCGKCHMGPDHPQIEIYNESKHGIAYRSRIAEMNLDSQSWILGKDYTAAPTCATCHMSATLNQPVTHDVGARISWTLRPVVSKKLERWSERRRAMMDVCQHCHSPAFVGAFYEQFDRSVEMYNEKFAIPAQRIMDSLRKARLITDSPFDDEIEWTFYLVWHHEGRRARMGVSMQGPDYTQWHGFFEVAHRFYFELIPQAEELARRAPSVRALIAEILDAPEHQWKKGLSAEERDKILEFYRERYGGAQAR